MISKTFVVRRVAVLGAGVMGAQIAAHMLNAGLETYLFDLSSEGPHRNALADKAIFALTKQMPAPLATADSAQLLKARNYDDHLAELAECDLIIEAIAERLDWKEALYQRITPFIAPHTVLVSNTSGLSIKQLAAALPNTLQQRFCGVHFFNPPRFMHLVELIASDKTDANLLDSLETWLTSRLGKGVVRAYDTPNFIANRIGVFSLLVTLHYAEQYQLSPDEVDALTGTALGRPKSATYRTIDVVGIDTLQHVVSTMREQLPDDPWHAFFQLPEWLLQRIELGHLGQKSECGIYRKQDHSIEVYDTKTQTYRSVRDEIHPEIKAILTIKNPPEQLQALLGSNLPQAQMLLACYVELFHYCAVHAHAIADNVRDVDDAMRWGFGWKHGPFATWQTFGLADIRALIARRMTKQSSLTQAALPIWLDEVSAFYREENGFSPCAGTYQAKRQLPVYARQARINASNPVLFENEAISVVVVDDDIAAVSFKSKANTIGQAVLDGLERALDVAEQQCSGFIVYQHDAAQFSLGADLREVSAMIVAERTDALDGLLQAFQRVALRLKYSNLPVIAALRGRALGGGCELMMQCDAVVAAFESYPGLVEAGVGLIPAGGGCKEFALRAATGVTDNTRMQLLSHYFEQIAKATVATSAPDALQRGFLRAGDHWVMHADEVLTAAIAGIKNLQALNYVPPLPTLFSVMGRSGHALLQAGLVNWLEGGFISAHDYFLSNELARVLCGGDVEQGQRVDEAWILRLEREAFIKLAMTQLSQARIRHVLETGKPLRN